MLTFLPSQNLLGKSLATLGSHSVERYGNLPLYSDQTMPHRAERTMGDSVCLWRHPVRLLSPYPDRGVGAGCTGLVVLPCVVPLPCGAVTDGDGSARGDCGGGGGFGSGCPRRRLARRSPPLRQRRHVR